MNFLPTYCESPPKKGTGLAEVAERKTHSDKARTSGGQRREGPRRDLIVNLDWGSNGLSSLDSLNLFPDLLTLILSENQIRRITGEVRHW